MKKSLYIPMVLLLAISLMAGACDTLQESVTRDPLGALQSITRIGSAAVKAGQEITEEQEIYLGRSVSARILSQYKLKQDQSLYKYVNLVGSTVAMVSDRPDLKYHFAVLDTDEVNAFAAPGGYIFITYGMIKRMANEEELAAVLAHEVGHVCARHSLKSVKSDLWKQVAVITAQETAKHGGVNPELLGLFGQATDKVVGTLVTVGYSQPMEFEADALGQLYAIRAGYDPGSLSEYLEEMNQRAKGRDQGLNARLGTHPSFQARLEKLPREQAQTPSPEIVAYRAKRFKSGIH